MIKIKDRWTNRVLFSSDKATDIKSAVEEAVVNKIDLTDASLDGASLDGASLVRASLVRASLVRASLDGASLVRARLDGARLDGASLVRASLDGASLVRASLVRASLDGASLDGASLVRASLDGARLDGARLDGASLVRARLDGASLVRARLDGARLDGASLVRASLVRASLVRASLDGARLDGASLVRASLDGASGLNKYLIQPLLILFDQPGKIRLYKVVRFDYHSPMYHMGCFKTGKPHPEALNFKIGAKLSVDDANTDVLEHCGAGINVAPLDWCLKQRSASGDSMRIVILECTANDIACIPTTTDGKIRLHRCKVVGELDYETYGAALPVEDNSPEEIPF